jgi:hypothetical protein
MKLKLCLADFLTFILFASVQLHAQQTNDVSTNSVHIWTFTSGKTVQGDFVSSGMTTLVIKKDGTNLFLPITALSDDDKDFVAQKHHAVLQAQFDAETNYFLKKGWVEFTKQRIENFPEQVNDHAGWMDCKFVEFDIKSDRLANLAGADFALNLVVEDKNSDFYRHIGIIKQNPDGQPNPIAKQAETLKRGDQIRITGVVMGASTDFESFAVDKIEMMVPAAQ